MSLAAALGPTRHPNYQFRTTHALEDGWELHFDLGVISQEKFDLRCGNLAEDPRFQGREIRAFSGKEIGLHLFDTANAVLVHGQEVYEDKVVVGSRPLPVDTRRQYK